MPLCLRFLLFTLVVAGLTGCRHEPAPRALTAPDTARARLLTEQAEQAGQAGRYDSALVYLGQAHRLYEAAGDWPGYARSAAKAGRWATLLGRYEEAHAYVDEALEEGRRRLNAHHPDLALVYSSLAFLHQEEGHHPAAFEAVEKALAIQRATIGEQHPDIARTYYVLGLINLQVGDFEASIAAYQNALRIYEATRGAEAPEVAEVYNDLAALHDDMGDYAQALEAVRRALRINRAGRGEAHPETGTNYVNLGTVHLSMGDYERARDALQQGLGIKLAAFGEQHPDVATIYQLLGGLAWEKGDYEGSVDYLLRSLRIDVAVRGEHHPTLGATYNELSNAYIQMGDYERALDALRNALRILRSTLGGEHWHVAVILHNMGKVHANRGDYAQARDAYRQALPISVAAFGEEHPNVAGHYKDLGVVTTRLGAPEEALGYNLKALRILRATMGDEHVYLSIFLDALGTTYEAMGDLERALAAYEEALRHRLDNFGDHHPVVAMSFNTIGDLHRRRGDLGRALESYASALRANVPDTGPGAAGTPARVLSDRDLINSLWGKARVLSARAVHRHNPSDLRAAVETYEEAVRAIDRLRRSVQPGDTRLHWAETAEPLLADAAAAALRLYEATGDERHKATAFFFSEKTKAGLLLEAVSEARARQVAGIPDSLLDQDRRLSADLTRLEQRLRNHRPGGGPGATAEIEAQQQAISALRQRREALIERFEQAYPDYFNLKYNVAVATPGQVRAALLDDQTALVEYLVGERDVYIFTLTPAAFDVTTVPRDTLLDRHVADLRQGIVEQDYDRYTTAAHALYRQLVAPVADRLQAANLIVVPDGVLHYVPFEALLTTDPAGAPVRDYRRLPYLVERYAVSYAYSSTLLLETQRRDRPAPERDYLALAPVFAGGLPAGSRGSALLLANLAIDTTRSATPGYLPATRTEVEGIQQLFEARYGFFERLFTRKTRLYLDEQAREAQLKAPAVHQYRYVHLATHGFVNEETPDGSGLVLFPEADTAAEDGVLRLGEVYDLRLNADLVALSACETGLGPLARGEGVMSLTRGFLYAGASNVLVSLWKTDDARTAEVMLRFYREVLEGNSKPAALRSARLGLIRGDPRYARPYYWASFVLVGK